MIIKPVSADGGHPRSRKYHLIGAQVGLLSITMAVVALRIYARGRIRALGVDDWLIVLALVGTLNSSHSLAHQC